MRRHYLQVNRIHLVVQYLSSFPLQLKPPPPTMSYKSSIQSNKNALFGGASSLSSTKSSSSASRPARNQSSSTTSAVQKPNSSGYNYSSTKSATSGKIKCFLTADQKMKKEKEASGELKCQGRVGSIQCGAYFLSLLTCIVVQNSSDLSNLSFITPRVAHKGENCNEVFLLQSSRSP